MKKIALAMSLAAGVLMAAAPAFPQNENEGRGQAVITVLPAHNDATPANLSQQDLAIKVDGKDRCKVAIQTNNLETDERGYIYIVDRANTGMHILELTPDAKKAAGVE